MDIDTALDETMRKMELASLLAPATAIERNVFEADGSIERFLVKHDRDVQDLKTQFIDLQQRVERDFVDTKLAFETHPVETHHLEGLDNLIQVIAMRATELSEAIAKSRGVLKKQVKEFSKFSSKGATRMNKQNLRMLEVLKKEVALHTKYTLLYRALRADYSNKQNSVRISSTSALDDFFDNLG
ncbi:hypothetical protein PsAD13_03220 [Pseudovibrio sp. Ad13]|uniref:hypothetical protein n=1 Tax=Pseudovibrio sp. Ad13 TaxID=989396 RepID=UPI0007AE5128|nr:hypothetical protein [Pseudovibrio sp. Ad13]KZK83018.1 hypothetical protein PsAD13_03220 [Pseudovibrio sp. Ad13]